VNKFLFSKEKKEEKNMSATIGFGKFRERILGIFAADLVNLMFVFHRECVSDVDNGDGQYGRDIVVRRILKTSIWYVQ
jgi:hypothetical protein